MKRGGVTEGGQEPPSCCSGCKKISNPSWRWPANCQPIEAWGWDLLSVEVVRDGLERKRVEQEERNEEKGGWQLAVQGRW